MQILRPTLTGIATMVLAGMLAASAADVAFAQAKDRQMESRGYRASRTAPPPETAKQPYDRQMESRGYRHHRHRHHKS